MIKNAKDTLLNQNPGTLPNMSSTLMDWQQPMTVNKITKSVVNYQLIETIQIINFYGVIESGTPEQLVLKPEAQRSWKWVNIWTLPNVDLIVDDVVQSLGKKYRIQSKLDWAQYGYNSYEAVEDWISE